MTGISRRRFNLLAGAAAGTALATPRLAFGAAARIVVIGGGFGGATAARYLKRLDKELTVTLVEPSRKFVTCPFSNLVLGGLRTMNDVTHSYELLAKEGVRMVYARATSVDGKAKKVTLSSGGPLDYDRLVVSPGIDLKWNALPGYDEKASERMPHAWKAGSQTTLLKRQLESMRDGGAFIVVAPDNPFRCPPGPYERVSMIAHYFKEKKPKSKIVILDTKESFSKQGLFQEGWQALYPGMIEFRPGKAGGKVLSVDPQAMTAKTEFGEEKGAVFNVIPPQFAGEIARTAGLANDSGWCPVDFNTFESKLVPGIHVIGDASIAGAMPKSGFSANSQAKVAALAILDSFKGAKTPPPSFANTCYSLVGPKWGISIAAVYRVTDKGLVAVDGAGGVSPTNAPAQTRSQEAAYAEGWYESITRDMFG